MKAYYTPDRPAGFHMLPPGEQTSTGAITVTARSLSTENRPTIAILADAQLEQSSLHLDWALGNGAHQDLVTQILGEPTRQSLIHHELPLPSSTVLRVGALACLGLDGGLPEVIVAGGHYAARVETARQKALPFNEEAQRLTGRIVLSSAQTFMELAEQTSCVLTLEFNDGHGADRQMEFGKITLAD